MVSKNAMRVKLYMDKRAADVFLILESGKFGVEKHIRITIAEKNETFLQANFIPETDTDKSRIVLNNGIVQGMSIDGKGIGWMNLLENQKGKDIEPKAYTGDALTPPETVIEDFGGKGE